MKSLGRFSYQHRRFVVLAWILLFVVVNLVAATSGSAYSNSLSLPGTDSTRAYDLLAQAFPAQKGDTDQIVFRTHHTSLRTPALAQRINKTLNTVAKLPGVTSVVSPLDNPLQVGEHSVSYAAVTFARPAYALSRSQIEKVLDVAKTLRSSALDVDFAGPAFAQLATPRGSPGEIFGILAAAIVLLLAFGSLYAMFLPIGVAVFALGIGEAATTLLSHSLSIASFAPILGSLIGIGVGIDYALFIVTRTRQALYVGASPSDAVVTAINTSGRAVLFAGATVCVALLGMVVLGLSFLNGVAVAASLTVVISMFAAVTLLPALLGFMGHKVLSRAERRRLGSGTAVQKADHWSKWAEFVARHPLRLTLAATVLMGLLAVPYFSMHLGSADQGSDPATSTTKHAYDALSAGFGPGTNGPLLVVARVSAPDALALEKMRGEISQLPEVQSVTPVRYSPGASRSPRIALFSVVESHSPQDTRTEALVSRIRVLLASYSPGAYVGGQTATTEDFAGVLGTKLPLFVGVIVLLGCLLLMVAFRSLVVALVAAAMNLIAAAAAFGVVVAVFQWGWGSSLIGAGLGPIEAFLPVIMISILFGLSMDYQVFLVSRMHEEWISHHDNHRAVSTGQASTGRVITAAALIMICVFASFVFGGQRVIAEFGVGLAAAVLLDAFVLRTVLVPALMHLLGRANWWMPAPLERLIPRLSLESASG